MRLEFMAEPVRVENMVEDGSLRNTHVWREGFNFAATLKPPYHCVVAPTRAAAKANGWGTADSLRRVRVLKSHFVTLH